MKKSQNSILLCCGGKGCPKLSKEKDGIIKIEDDFGGSVKLKASEARLIAGALDQLKIK